MAKTPVDKLAEAVQQALTKYAQDTTTTTKVLVRTIAKKGAQSVKQSAVGAYGNGRYSRGWTSTVEETRLGATGIIYNKTPGLPHLLEHGHAKRGGGRVPGRAHIAPVEEELVKDFPKELEARL